MVEEEKKAWLSSKGDRFVYEKGKGNLW